MTHASKFFFKIDRDFAMRSFAFNEYFCFDKSMHHFKILKQKIDIDELNKSNFEEFIKCLNDENDFN